MRECLHLVWAASRGACGWAAILQVVGGVAIAVELLAGKQLLSALFAAAETDSGLGTVAPELGLVVGTGVVIAVLTALQSEQQRVVAELVTRYVDDRLMRVAVAVDLEAFETPAFFDRLQRALIAGQSRPWQMTVSLLSFVTGLVTVAGICIALLTIEPILIPLVAISSLPLWLATLRNSHTAHAFAYGITTTDRERRYLAHVLMGREFAKEVRIFDLAPPLRTRYEQLYDRRVDELRVMVRTRLRRLLPAGILSAVLTAATLAILVSMVLDGRLELSAATIAAIAVQQLMLRLRSIYASAGSLHEGALFLEDFNTFVALEPTLEDAAPPTAAPPGFSTLAVDDVSFCYPGSDRWALRHVSCRVDRGQVVALVGRNGSGKTTLAKLLCSLYEPTEGRILWDDVDVHDCDPQEVRRSVSGVFQDFAQFHLTVRENIAVGRHERSDDAGAIERAAVQAGAHDLITGLPDGYSTRLGRQFEGGRELSMGQWQRVAMARAFFRDAPLLVLDEPTAALDPQAEQDLFDRMRDLAAGKTVVLISHRFSSVRSADHIYVLDEGCVVEEGTHEELVELDGLYARLFSLQAAAYLDLRPPAPSSETGTVGSGARGEVDEPVRRV